MQCDLVLHVTPPPDTHTLFHLSSINLMYVHSCDISPRWLFKGFVMPSEYQLILYCVFQGILFGRTHNNFDNILRGSNILRYAQYLNIILCELIAEFPKYNSHHLPASNSSATAPEPRPAHMFKAKCQRQEYHRAP